MRDAIQEPTQQLNRITLYINAELLLTLQSNGLQQFVRTHLSLEITRIPYLFNQIRETLRNECLQVKDVLVDCVVEQNDLIAQVWNAAQCLDDHIHVVIHFNIIQSYETWLIVNAVQCTGFRRRGVQYAELCFGVDWREIVFDIT